MRSLALLIALGFGLSACIGGYGGKASYRLLNDPLHDYYYGTDGSPTDDDPTFSYGWDIGP